MGAWASSQWGASALAASEIAEHGSTRQRVETGAKQVRTWWVHRNLRYPFNDQACDYWERPMVALRVDPGAVLARLMTTWGLEAG